MAISHSREPDILELFSWHFPVNLSRMTAEAVEYRNKEIYYYHAHTMDSCGDWPFKTFFYNQHHLGTQRKKVNKDSLILI